jgi:DNA-binding CsgD family transcriptional regulator
MDLMGGVSVARVQGGNQRGETTDVGVVTSLQPFLNGLVEPVIVVDPFGRVVFANPAFERRWQRPTGVQRLVAVNGHGAHLDVCSPSGEVGQLPVQLFPVHDGNGHPVAVLASHHDDTPVADELAHLRALLDALATRLGTLVPEQRSGVDDATAERLATLSEREREILDHLLHGERVATVAKALYLSEHTVRNYLKRIYRKMGVHSLGELREQLGSLAP